MGMFDHICCELPLPDGQDVAKDSFQTKAMWCGMDLLTITAAGRLVHHRRRYYTASEKNPRMPERVEDIDLDYHGDMESYGSTPGGALAHYAVRFTHGTVEWILPFDALRSHHRWHPYRDY
jgi:hypothetical protein